MGTPGFPQILPSCPDEKKMCRSFLFAGTLEIEHVQSRLAPGRVSEPVLGPKGTERPHQSKVGAQVGNILKVFQMNFSGEKHFRVANSSDNIRPKSFGGETAHTHELTPKQGSRTERI